MTLGQILGPGGNLSRALSGFEDRPEQLRMAEAVAAALEDERPLLVEAGTGTGKTLAYLVPAALSGKRVVVSTGTRALQEQLIAHDLPLCQAALGRPVRAAVLKGVSNYLCRRRAAALELELGGLDAELDAIRTWMLATETGDRAEMGALGTDSHWWQLITTSPEGRLGPRCPHHEACFVTRARRAAEKAEIVIVNHHLFFADLALRGSSPGARVLPDYAAVVFDEAHLLEDVMTEHFGLGVSTVKLALFVKDLTAVGLETRGIERAAAGFFAAVRDRLGALLFDGKVALPDGLFSDPDLRAAWFELDGALEAAETAAKAAAARSDGEPEEWEAVARRAAGMRSALSDLAEPDREAGRRAVRWGEAKGAAVFLRAAPIDVSDVLRERVLSSVPTAIFTSATLTSGRRFTYVRERLGLTPEVCDELHLDSPFDYARQAMLYVPRDLPAPGEPTFTAAACARAAELFHLTGGRAFFLVTSHRALREAAAILPAMLSVPLLVQGQAPPPVLLERFKSGASVLLATGTFWAGVDVPGPALSLVVMDKLPFASPGDPLTAARGEALEAAGRDPFAELSVPQAALAFRQGFGRLIRRRDDRGIAAVLDGRIVQKRYGQSFLTSLPTDLPRTSAFEVLRRWWGDGEAAATAAAAPGG